MSSLKRAYTDILTRWVELILRRNRITMALVVLSVGLCAAYAATNLRINSDTEDLVRQDEPFRLYQDDFRRAFPHTESTTLIVVSAETPRKAEDAAEKLAARLKQELAPGGLLISSYYAQGLPFFQKNAFLYLGVDELQDLVDDLAAAQPALTTLSDDPSLRGLLRLINLALENAGDEPLPGEFEDLLKTLTRAAEEVNETGGTRIALADELFADIGDPPTDRIIVVQGRQDFASTLSSGDVIRGIRAIAKEEGLTPANGITVRLTGDVPLSHEEMQSALTSAQDAGLLSLVLLTLVLGFGVRSLRIILATVATLFVGLTWTVAFAALTVGEFNMLSMTFAVLFIGLGVDFAIHLTMRYQEELAHGAEHSDAFLTTTHSLGPAISLCAVTSAIGFLAFWPTDYRGLAELGIISGGGMFLAFFASITVLPAILGIMGRPTGRAPDFAVVGVVARLFTSMTDHYRWLSAAAILIGIAAGIVAAQARFDFSVLKLKNPQSESVLTLRELQEKDVITDYTISVLVEPGESREAIAQRLVNLPAVDKVVLPGDYVPAEQELKMAIIEEAQLILFPFLVGGDAADAPSPEDNLNAVDEYVAIATDLDPAKVPEGIAATSAELARAFNKLTLREDTETAIAALDASLTSGLTRQLDRLRTALDPAPFTFDDIPLPARERIIGEDGRARLVVFPAEDIRDVDALERFVEQVTAEVPQATGRPVVEYGVGMIVANALVTAMILAAVTIFILLLGTLRSVTDVVLVISPIVLAGCLTIASSIAIGLDFNFANVILLPLIIGLGVDNGIHVVMRFRDEHSIGGVLRSSTPRAVFLSALTTLGSFGSLAFASHFGIKSMGLMLTFAMIYLIICTIVVLPAFITLRNRLFEKASS